MIANRAVCQAPREIGDFAGNRYRATSATVLDAAGRRVTTYARAATAAAAPAITEHARSAGEDVDSLARRAVALGYGRNVNAPGETGAQRAKPSAAPTLADKARALGHGKAEK